MHQKAAVGLNPIPEEMGVWDRGTRRPREVPKELQKSHKYGQPAGLNRVLSAEVIRQVLRSFRATKV